MKLLMTVLVLLGAVQMAAADVPARLEAAFAKWTEDVGADRATMAIFQNGKQVRHVNLGWQADEPQEMASLSKAVTAACVAHIIHDGIWSAQTTSRHVLGEGADGITVAQLLTHGSGLGPDQTQASMLRWLDKSGRRARQAGLRALSRTDQTGIRGQFEYNNENYAVLGAMIEAETNETYEAYCGPRVLAPSGVTTASPSARTGRFLPWGGWVMSVQDFAAFHWHSYGPDGIIGQDPMVYPFVALDGGAQSGMGMFQRKMARSHNYWHFGAHCFPGRLNVGSYAVIWQAHYSVAAAYDICATYEQMAALDAALAGAVFQ